MTPTHIIIHHSAGPDGNTMEWAGIRRFHKDIRGWRDIGYHAGIEYIDGDYEVLFGRPMHARGAHAGPKWNGKSLGFAFVGNYSIEAPPPEMLEVAVYRCLRAWVKVFSIPKSNIIGHRDTKNTECPGKLFDLQRLKALI